MLQPVEQLLLDLLHIPSETGDEIQVTEFLYNKLQEDFLGARLEKIMVDESRYNILMIKGEPETLLVAHIDTVVGDLEVGHDDKTIFGRGSCDNKNSVAAMYVAAQQAQQDGKNNYGLLFTVGEESTFDGAMAAQTFFAENNIQPELVVVGEPTQGKIVTAQKGILCVELICRGTQEHSSVENLDSAIHTLLDVLNVVREIDVPQSIMNIALINGGVAENIVAGEARATVTWRTSSKNAKQIVRDQLAQCGIEYELIIHKDIQPAQNNDKRFEKHEVSYFTEMYFFENAIVLGAGDIKHAHTKNEHIQRKELQDIVTVYEDLL